MSLNYMMIINEFTILSSQNAKLKMCVNFWGVGNLDFNLRIMIKALFFPNRSFTNTVISRNSTPMCNYKIRFSAEAFLKLFTFGSNCPLYKKHPTASAKKKTNTLQSAGELRSKQRLKWNCEKKRCCFRRSCFRTSLDSLRNSPNIPLSEPVPI